MNEVKNYIEKTEDKDVLEEIFICCKDRLDKIDGQEKSAKLKEYIEKKNIKTSIEIKISTYCCDRSSTGARQSKFTVGPMTFTYYRYITDIDYEIGKVTVMSDDYDDNIIKNQYGYSDEGLDYEDDTLKSMIEEFCDEDLSDMEYLIKVVIEFIHFKKWDA